MRLLSPTSGHPLAHAEPHALRDNHGERWPVVAGIPYLRAGRDRLVASLLDRLDAGDHAAALLLALGDQDDWDPTPPPGDDACAAAVAAPTLRSAMAALGFGPVADYFAYRWSDPTFLSGLGLLDTGLASATRVFELGCGIGHFLRELAPRGVSAAGGDVVFAKLWLAKRFVVPTAALVCFDAGWRFPLPDDSADACLCHDVLHYLPDLAHALVELRRVGGRILVGHVHNAEADNLSPGAPLDVAGYAALAPDATFYDDAAVGQAALDGRTPAGAAPQHLRAAAAIAFIAPAARPAPTGVDRFAVPAPGARLRLNPLLHPLAGDPAPVVVRWPSARYEREYAPLSEHLRNPPPVPRALLVNSVRAGEDQRADTLARQRVLLDLPDSW
jgi:SAM-dependent methyltransferase